jgi:ElaB/YqjD/DUF883 family membrane-anchored ribosome-binding protein
MKEFFEYDGVDREDFEEALEIVGEEKFMAICMLTTSEMLEEHGEDLLEQAEEAKARAKQILKEEEAEA